MRRFWLNILILLVMSLSTFPVISQEKNTKETTNNYPIILVHGFAGWGPEELLGYKYWGGTACDIQKYLREQGAQVYTASVGAISSNHDRACELFYQIKGGAVDYGAEHSQHYGHLRTGKSYPGFYCSWDASHPVHLIGHSMGGQTIRMLVELLARDFFACNTSETWVKSVTTLSTPNNGTTLATLVDKFAGGYAEEIVAGFLGLARANWKVYDFDMAQWNLTPQPEETLHVFLKRVDKVLGNTEDISLYDLLPRGAQKLNENVRNFPQVYYFSYATDETYVFNKNSGYYWAEPGMNPMFWGLAYQMGRYQGKDVSPAPLWWPNDGVVNTISMKCPANAKAVPYQGLPVPGVWNYMGLIHKDHGKIIGHYQDPLLGGRWLQDFYRGLVDVLYRLP